MSSDRTGERALDHAVNAAAEITTLVAAVDPASLDALVDRIDRGGRVYASGHGRSGLVARAIAMRLMHLGIPAHVVGETGTPAIESGDLLLVISSSGAGAPALAQAATARRVGADVVALSARPDVALAAESAEVIVVPARVEVASSQHAGSLFEQGCLVLGDAVCSALQARRGVTTDEMDARHANLQ